MLFNNNPNSSSTTRFSLYCLIVVNIIILSCLTLLQFSHLLRRSTRNINIFTSSPSGPFYNHIQSLCEDQKLSSILLSAYNEGSTSRSNSSSSHYCEAFNALQGLSSEQVYYDDAQYCTNLPMSKRSTISSSGVISDGSSSTIHMIESKMGRRSCDVTGGRSRISRYLVAKNVSLSFEFSFLHASTPTRVWNYHDPSNRAISLNLTPPHRNRTQYCAGMENWENPSIVSHSQPYDESRSCTKVVSNGVTFVFDRYQFGGSIAKSWHMYHGMHGILGLFGAILDARPDLFNFNTFEFDKNSIRLILLKRRGQWDDPNGKERYILKMFTSHPIVTLDQIDGKAGDRICFRDVVFGTSTRMYLPLGTEDNSRFSARKRRYFTLFREFVYKNTPRVDVLPVQVNLNEPRIYFLDRSNTNVQNAGRSIINAKELRSFLTDPKRFPNAKYVHFLDPATLTLEQQINLFREKGTIVAGMYGAAFMNLLWLNPDGGVAIMHEHTHINENVYESLASLTGVSFYRHKIDFSTECRPNKKNPFDSEAAARSNYLIHEPLSEKQFSYFRDADCTVDLLDIRILLDKAVKLAKNALLSRDNE